MFKEWIMTMLENRKGIVEMTEIFAEIPADVSFMTAYTMRSFNIMSALEFFKNFGCTKQTYWRRVKQYGDPYMNSPLAKFGKMLQRVKGS